MVPVPRPVEDPPMVPVPRPVEEPPTVPVPAPVEEEEPGSVKVFWLSVVSAPGIPECVVPSVPVPVPAGVPELVCAYPVTEVAARRTPAAKPNQILLLEVMWISRLSKR
jgi:hypothetical protein